MSTRYNLDERFLLRNKVTGGAFINDPAKKKIFTREKNTGKTVAIADFCFTDIVWNDSSKDIDSITLDGTSGSTEYVLQSNHAALKNRIFKECYPYGGIATVSNPDKKFMHFAVNGFLYEFIQLIVRAIQNDELPIGLEAVTLAITSADTEEFTNGSVIVTAKNESNNAIKDLAITGTIGDVEVDGTTDANGQVTTTLTEAGTYDIAVESEATDEYKAASKTAKVTVTAIEPESDAQE